jgi:hypothetical protein
MVTLSSPVGGESGDERIICGLGSLTGFLCIQILVSTQASRAGEYCDGVGWVRFRFCAALLRDAGDVGMAVGGAS